jgi:hypothetical protein
MLIHSVTPAQFLQPEDSIARSTLRDMGTHLLEGAETPEGFCLSRLHSTDPAMYLNPAYAPGRIVAGRALTP